MDIYCTGRDQGRVNVPGSLREEQGAVGSLGGQDKELVLDPKGNAGTEGALLSDTPSCWRSKQTTSGWTDRSLVGNAC